MKIMLPSVPLNLPPPIPSLLDQIRAAAGHRERQQAEELKRLQRWRHAYDRKGKKLPVKRDQVLNSMEPGVGYTSQALQSLNPDIPRSSLFVFLSELDKLGEITRSGKEPKRIYTRKKS